MTTGRINQVTILAPGAWGAGGRRRAQGAAAENANGHVGGSPPKRGHNPAQHARPGPGRATQGHPPSPPEFPRAPSAGAAAASAKPAARTAWAPTEEAAVRR